MPSIDATHRYRRDRSVSPYSAPISAAVGNKGKYPASQGSIRYSVDGAASVSFPADGGGSAAVSIRDSVYDRSSIRYPVSVSPSSSTTSGRAGGFGFSPDPAPPPGADPRLWSGFLKVDVDHSGYISVHELQAALFNGDSTPFDTETVKLLISLFDTNRTGEIDFKEFTKLSGYIDQWQLMFEHFDKDHSGTIDVSELQGVMNQIGSQLPLQLVMLIVAKFASSPSGSRVGEQTITFDRFIRACVFVTKFQESFAEHDKDKDGLVHLNYQQCMKFCLMLP